MFLSGQNFSVSLTSLWSKGLSSSSLKICLCLYDRKESKFPNSTNWKQSQTKMTIILAPDTYIAIPTCQAMFEGFTGTNSLLFPLSVDILVIPVLPTRKPRHKATKRHSQDSALSILSPESGSFSTSWCLIKILKGLLYKLEFLTFNLSQKSKGEKSKNLPSEKTRLIMKPWQWSQCGVGTVRDQWASGTN